MQVIISYQTLRQNANFKNFHAACLFSENLQTVISKRVTQKLTREKNKDYSNSKNYKGK